MAVICELRNELSALFMLNAPALVSERYMPVVSIVTASLPRFSTDCVISSLCISWSSGASMVNCRPMSLSVFVSSTPHSNVTLRPTPASFVTVVLFSSVAVMFRRGFIASPKNST